MNRNNLIKYLQLFKIRYTAEQVDKLLLLMSLTLKKNEVMNLTAIKDENEFIIKMLIDSLLPLSKDTFKAGKAIDVGTGAGFPGLPLKVFLPDVDFCLLDSTSKKINHIKEVAKELNVKISTSTKRMEIYAREVKEHYDYAFARAVADINILIEMVVPTLKVGGLFYVLKGPSSMEEIDRTKKALVALDSEILYIENFLLPEEMGARNIIVIRKNKPSKKKYPRNYSDIKSKTL